jgi:hypothetical protein
MWKSRCYRYCDANIFLNKIRGCATVLTVGGHTHTNIYTEVFDPKNQVSVPCSDVSHVLVGVLCTSTMCSLSSFEDTEITETAFSPKAVKSYE